MSHNKIIVDGVPSSKHALYGTWANMRQRCRDSNHKDYIHYGAKGIKVCEEWHSNFANFVADMGARPEGHTLDRIDYSGDYCKSNCRWATAEQQARNQAPRRTGFTKGAYKNSPTKHAGIYPMPTGKFRAVVFINGKNKHIGCFDTISLASEARLEALKA